MKIHFIEARDLPDLWFQAINDIFHLGKKYKIDHGSYTGQIRLEYDFFLGKIKYPGTIPLLPEINPNMGIPNPVDYDYIFTSTTNKRSYLEYLMTDSKKKFESYTYGERLTKTEITNKKLKYWEKKNENMINIKNIDGKIIFKKNNKLYINQIEWLIDFYKKFGYNNNQLILQIGEPSDIILKDPPCLRQIDTKIKNDKLNFIVYFRSWDLWSGLPANLAGIQIMKEYIASEIGVKDGEMIIESKGLHLYGFAEKLAKIRCLKTN